MLNKNNNDDFDGIREAGKGNYKEAKRLLNSSLEADPQNVWLLVQLAKISLFQGEIENFEKYIKKGREIYPKYEPFYLLEAQQLYNEERYKASYEKLEELIRVNQRYVPAAPLLKTVKEKLSIN